VRHTIRALGWGIIILWVITLLLPITVGLSLLKLMEPNAIGFREQEISYSDGMFSLSAPFYINNTGHYDLSDINVTVSIRRKNKAISTFSTLLPDVPAGNITNSCYTLSLSLEEIVSKNLKLLTDDTDLDLNISAFFRVAYVIGIGISTSMKRSWTAPFYNLTVSPVSYNFSSQKLSLSVSFENHTYFTMNGTILLKIYNDRSELVGFTEMYLDIPANRSFHDVIEVTIDPFNITESGFVRIYLEDEKILEKEWNLSG